MIFKKLLVIFLAVFAAVLILLIALLGYFYLQSPVKQIDRLVYPVKIKSQKIDIVRLNGEKRIYLNYTFQRNEADTFRITISKPAKSSNKRLPVIFILGGLEIGRKSLKYIQHHGPNILIAYEYPYRPKYWYDGAAIEQIPLIRKSVLMVPGQVTQLIQWVKKQSWCDTTKISLLGYSFGALAIPSIVYLLNLHKTDVQAVVMAYGGVNIYRILQNNLKTIPSGVRPAIAFLASTAIRPIEPSLYVPYLSSNFLIINGKYDKQIPKESWLKLHRQIPQPKKIVLLEAGHIHPRKRELIALIISISQQWLFEQGTINPTVF